jgi:hypothetical protein
VKHTHLITLLLVLGSLTACSEMNPHPMDMTQAVQNAKSNADHEALAKRYEEAAKEMQLKAEEHKKLLSQYESKSYLYGRHAQSFKDHCQALINAYEKASEAGLSMANMYRQM